MEQERDLTCHSGESWGTTSASRSATYGRARPGDVSVKIVSQGSKWWLAARSAYAAVLGEAQAASNGNVLVLVLSAALAGRFLLLSKHGG